MPEQSKKDDESDLIPLQMVSGGETIWIDPNQPGVHLRKIPIQKSVEELDEDVREERLYTKDEIRRLRYWEAFEKFLATSKSSLKLSQLNPLDHRYFDPRTKAFSFCCKTEFYSDNYEYACLSKIGVSLFGEAEYKEYIDEYLYPIRSDIENEIGWPVKWYFSENVSGFSVINIGPNRNHVEDWKNQFSWYEKIASIIQTNLLSDIAIEGACPYFFHQPLYFYKLYSFKPYTDEHRE